MDQLMAAKLISKEMFEGAGYKFEIFVTGDKFEAFAVPVEYGKNGKTSYFIDQTQRLARRRSQRSFGQQLRSTDSFSHPAQKDLESGSR